MNKPLLIGLAAVVIVIAAMVKIGVFGALLSNNDSSQAIKEQAEQGDARAQLELGQYYLHGVGVEKDDTQALAWVLKSAERSHPPAMRLAGMMYKDGQGSGKDSEVALLWLEKAYNASDDMAAYVIGSMFESGDGVEKSAETAFSWYQKGADRAETWAQYGLANLYRYEVSGYQVDLKQAAEWYRLSADQGHMYAQYELAWLYYHGKGIEQDIKQAETWYRRSAEQGYWLARNNLAWMLSTSIDDSKRNGRAALKTIETVDMDVLAEGDRATVLDTFAASYAEVGRYVDAIIAQEKVIAIYAKTGANKKQIEGCEERLHQYRQNRPWRE